MATRTKQADLVALAEMINTRLGIEDDGEKYTIGHQDGSPRLHRAKESVDVSPRLPAGRLEEWLRAFLAGISTGREVFEPGGASRLAPPLTATCSDAIEDAARELIATSATPVYASDRPVCVGCGESYSPDDEELHERCSS